MPSELISLPRSRPHVTREVELVRIATNVRDTDLAEAAMRSARDRANLNQASFDRKNARPRPGPDAQ